MTKIICNSNETETFFAYVNVALICSIVPVSCLHPKIVSTLLVLRFVDGSTLKIQPDQLDHLIIGEYNHVSLAERGLLQ